MKPNLRIDQGYQTRHLKPYNNPRLKIHNKLPYSTDLPRLRNIVQQDNGLGDNLNSESSLNGEMKNTPHFIPPMH